MLLLKEALLRYLFVELVCGLFCQFEISLSKYCADYSELVILL